MTICELAVRRWIKSLTFQCIGFLLVLVAFPKGANTCSPSELCHFSAMKAKSLFCPTKGFGIIVHSIFLLALFVVATDSAVTVGYRLTLHELLPTEMFGVCLGLDFLAGNGPWAAWHSRQSCWSDQAPQSAKRFAGMTFLHYCFIWLESAYSFFIRMVTT